MKACLPVVEGAEAESLALRVCPQIRLKPERIDCRDEGLRDTVVSISTEQTKKVTSVSHNRQINTQMNIFKKKKKRKKKEKKKKTRTLNSILKNTNQT